MRNIIPINNSTNYTSDIVTCFERPIVNLLNYSNHLLGDCFLLIAKIYSFYFNDLSKNSKFQILQLSEEFLNIKIENFHCGNIRIKEVIKSINQDIPIVFAVNLYDVFYSDYYKDTNWPHWLLVNGYDTEKNILFFLDDVQYRNQINSFGDFCLPVKLLNKAICGYEAIYEKDFSKFRVISSNEIDIKTILFNVIEYYLLIMTQM